MSLDDALQRHGLAASPLTVAEYQRPGDGLVYSLRVPVEEALARWDELRALVPETGYWPVIGWDRFRQPPWEEEPTWEIIQTGMLLDVKQWFEREGIASALDPAREARYGDAPHPPFAFQAHRQRFAYTPRSFAPIALVPADVPWKVPAFLRFTDDTQEPPVHVAVMKYWFERWGAELVAWDTASAELRVLRPPQASDATIQLAKEQYTYCPDVVIQETRSVSTLARVLVGSAVWRFWWD
jgi:hypothetical protein